MIRKRFITNFIISVMPERQCLIFNYKLVIWTSRPSKLTKEENIIIRSFSGLCYQIQGNILHQLYFHKSWIHGEEKTCCVDINLFPDQIFLSHLIVPSTPGSEIFFGILLEENQGGKLEEERYFLGPGWRRERESGRVWASCQFHPSLCPKHSPSRPTSGNHPIPSPPTIIPLASVLPNLH